jgi:glycosidase
MQTTLGGTIFVYQGEEAGMRNIPASWPIEGLNDIETLNYWKKCIDLYTNDEEQVESGCKIINVKAREHSKNPMQWSERGNSGFCDPGVKPWMEWWKTTKALTLKLR